MLENRQRGLPRSGRWLVHPIVRLNLTFAVMFLTIAWPSLGLAATLTWNANTETDLAGYRVYQCTQQPCGRASGTANLLATLGKVTTFDIGTPAVVQFYVVTAYDFSNNESSDSVVAIYTPATPTPIPTPTPMPTPAPTPTPPSSASLTLNVLGLPNLGQPWTVEAIINASVPFSVEVLINGAIDHTEQRSPFCAFGESNGSCTRVQRPAGTYTIEFRVLNNGTELARQARSITAAAPPVATPPVPPPAPTNLQLSFVQ